MPLKVPDLQLWRCKPYAYKQIRGSMKPGKLHCLDSPWESDWGQKES